MELPVSILSPNLRYQIGLMLSPMKYIPAESGVLRDWRGLAEKIVASSGEVQHFESQNDPSEAILKLYGGKLTISKLVHFLEEMDRFDILNDLLPSITDECQKYKERLDAPPRKFIELNSEREEEILTIHDAMRLSKGLPPDHFDAFLLYAESDAGFAQTIIDKMEVEFNLRLCVKDRDLVAGITFQHEAISKLISERCNRVLIIISPSFLASEENKFLANFAQALGIEQRRRKIIPCFRERCPLPPHLSFYSCLDYSRTDKFGNFWEKLRDSLRTAEVELRKNSPSIQGNLNNSTKDKKTPVSVEGPTADSGCCIDEQFRVANSISSSELKMAEDNLLNEVQASAQGISKSDKAKHRSNEKPLSVLLREQIFSASSSFLSKLKLPKSAKVKVIE